MSWVAPYPASATAVCDTLLRRGAAADGRDVRAVEVAAAGWQGRSMWSGERRPRDQALGRGWRDENQRVVTAGHTGRKVGKTTPRSRGAKRGARGAGARKEGERGGSPRAGSRSAMATKSLGEATAWESAWDAE